MRVVKTRINLIGLMAGLMLISSFCSGCGGDMVIPIADHPATRSTSTTNVVILHTPELPDDLGEHSVESTERKLNSPNDLPGSSPTSPEVISLTPIVTDTGQNDDGSVLSLEDDPWVSQVPFTISNIGDGSQVLSPIHIEIQAIPSIGPPLIIALYGKDGRLIARRLLLLSETSSPHLIEIDLRFEIADISEQGRLVVSAKDEADRIYYLQSRDILFLRDGDERIVQPEKQPIITITSPTESSVVSGSSLTVLGESCSQSLEPLRISLVREDGSVVGQRLAGLVPGGEGECASFTTEIDYLVNDRTPVRLMVYQSGSPISEIKYLTSVPIVLTP